MGRGKLATQVAHASLTAYLETMKVKPEWAEEWLNTGQKKIVLMAPNLEELLSVKRRVEEDGIPTALIQDAGRTQLEPGTVTALGIGPGPEALIDKTTRHLKLL